MKYLGSGYGSKLGVDVNIVEGDARKIIQMSEEVVKKYAKYRKVSIPSFGVIKLDKILDQFPEGV